AHHAPIRDTDDLMELPWRNPLGHARTVPSDRVGESTASTVTSARHTASPAEAWLRASASNCPPGDAGLTGPGLPAVRLLPGEPAPRLRDEVGMAVVPGVLLDHVDQDPPQAGRPPVGPGAPGQPPQAAIGQRLRGQGAGAGHGVLPQRAELLRGVLRGRVP